MNLRKLILLSIFSGLLFSCASDDDYGSIDDDCTDCPTQESPVNLDLSLVPYTDLSDYNFFEEDEIWELKPSIGVLPYRPSSELFSDYAKKSRFIWMPNDVKATYNGDENIMNYPPRTVFIKNFYYDNVLPNNSRKILETRLIIRRENDWIFANYVWNEEQTAATYNMNGSFVPIQWNHNGTVKQVNYRIPAGEQCLMCHKTAATAIPLGPKPQNLNMNYNYADGTMNQLQKWEEMGFLDSNYPSNIQSVVDYSDSSQDLEKRVRSYFDINCAHCHTSLGHCDYRPLRLAFIETEDEINMGVCVEPDTDISFFLDGQEPSHIIYPGDSEKSVTYFRMDTELENIKMPLIGRELIHEEGVNLVVEWINSLQSTCE